MIRFSVIIPVYNIAPYLKSCINSVVAAVAEFEKVHPTLGIEIICVDDGSSDQSGPILDHEEGIMVIHKVNGGVGSARNAGLDVARGEYVCFIDGDDGIESQYFVRLHEIVDKTQADLIRIAYRGVKSADDPDTFQEKSIEPFVVNIDDPASACTAFRLVVSATWAWSAIIRRSCIGNLRFQSMPNGEDILFVAEALFRVHRIALTDDVLYKYMYRAESAVHACSLRHVKSVCEMAVGLKVATDKWKYGQFIQKQLNRKLRCHLITEAAKEIGNLSEDEQCEAWKCFFHALSFCAWSCPVKLMSHLKWRWPVAWLIQFQNLRGQLGKFKFVAWTKKMIRGE